jgi:hypothetical protein
VFVGHLGVGLALRRAAPAVSLGVLFAAVLLADFLLGLFVLLGVERVIVPPDYARLHYLHFEFPYSHGLLATLGWAGLAVAGAAAWYRTAPRRAAAAGVVGLAVLSHFACDLVEHPPQLPVAGLRSPRLGLGLWQHLGLALALEAALVLAGLTLYLGATPHPGRVRRYALVAVMIALSALAFAGQALAAAPPSTVATVVAWLVQPLVLGGFGMWVDRGAA